MPYFWQLAINPKLKIQESPLGMLILMEKIFLNLYPPLENSTTRIAIVFILLATQELPRQENESLKKKYLIEIIWL